MDNFKEVFGHKYDSAYLTPARLNLIGEHIDYNGGLVMPAAISLYIKGYFKKREDNKIKLYSKNTGTLVEASFDDLEYDSKRDWANYPIGMVYILKNKGLNIAKGFEIFFESNIPLGSGLSSSAAILDLTCFIMSCEFKLDLDFKTIALYACETENKYCNLSSGIMDQMAIALGRKNNAILLNCATKDYEYIPFDFGKYRVAILQTNKKRSLTESKYNERVIECNEGLKLLKAKFNINNLCELKNKDLDQVKELIKDETVFRRVRHVIKENERVYEFKKALLECDVKECGKILNESHFSLRDDYEVTGLHLDTITELSRKNKYCLGARMTGAGFGGCGIAIIEASKIDEFKEEVLKGYKEITGVDGNIYLVDVVDGPKKI